ncbi:hypothetical protein M0805_000164 [Coniferiporia weirii]|nr:hypothetical protein M0805_000164 [Coniferiporia weirii]
MFTPAATLKLFVVLAYIFAVAFAQRVSIGSPESNQTFHAGQEMTVSVAKPDSLSGSTEVGVGITLHHCTQSPCEDVTQALGYVLYSGAYDPQPTTSSHGSPAQNFSIYIPEKFAAGAAVLSVAHASLAGAGPYLFTEIVSMPVNIA